MYCFFAQLREIVMCALPESPIFEIGHCLQVTEAYSLLVLLKVIAII